MFTFIHFLDYILWIFFLHFLKVIYITVQYFFFFTVLILNIIFHLFVSRCLEKFFFSKRWNAYCHFLQAMPFHLRTRGHICISSQFTRFIPRSSEHANEVLFALVYSIRACIFFFHFVLLVFSFSRSVVYRDEDRVISGDFVLFGNNEVHNLGFHGWYFYRLLRVLAFRLVGECLPWWVSSVIYFLFLAALD